MTELENLAAQVWNPDTRPLVDEAWRCYNSGAIRASIAATWTAITADIIAKIVQLADEGDAAAVAFHAEVTNAQEKGISQDGVRAMQNIEATVLVKAVEFELIDSIGQRELDRVREDRNLCVHPSLRIFSEVYEPRPEVARGHLAVALTALLIHPPIQGKRILDSFFDYTCDPSFVPVTSHIQTTFFDNVRSTARRNITKIAAKHALRELDPNGRLPPIEYANRSAVVLSAFAQRDRALVRSALVAERDHFQKLDGGTLLRALIRIGDEDYFWDFVDQALAERFQALLSVPVTDQEWEPLAVEVAAPLAMVRSELARARLPVLEKQFTMLSALHRMNVVAIQSAPYFVPAVIEFLTHAWSFRTGEQAGQLLLRHAPYLTVDTLREALAAWAENSQCREAAQMPELSAALFHDTAHLGSHQPNAFVDFLVSVQSQARPGDSYYRYPALEEALRADGHHAATGDAPT